MKVSSETNKVPKNLFNVHIFCWWWLWPILVIVIAFEWVKTGNFSPSSWACTDRHTGKPWSMKTCHDENKEEEKKREKHEWFGWDVKKKEKVDFWLDLPLRYKQYAWIVIIFCRCAEVFWGLKGEEKKMMTKSMKHLCCFLRINNRTIYVFG